MDYQRRQGSRKLRYNLEQVRNFGFEQISQPDVVYHMTDRENLESILKDGQIKQFNDFVTYFFSDVRFVPIFCELSRAYQGRQYYGTDGRVLTADPVIPENTVVLKLVPRRKEPDKWFREPAGSIKGSADDSIKELWDKFNEARLAHYGNMVFSDRDGTIEIIELKDILDHLDDGTKAAIEKIHELQGQK